MAGEEGGKRELGGGKNRGGEMGGGGGRCEEIMESMCCLFYSKYSHSIIRDSREIQEK
jgi:hypothetical protein